MAIALESRLISFTLKGTDEKEYRPENYSGVKVLGAIFSCNHCPYAQAWEGRLMRIPARSASLTCAARSRPCSEGRRRRRQRPNRWAAPSSGSDLICHCEPEGRSNLSKRSPRPFGPRDDC